MGNDVVCRIWASETSPRGREHRCHAKSNGLEGGVFSREMIAEVLKRTPTWGGFGKDRTWHLIACEPNHDGKACENCEYKYGKGLSHYYDSETQNRAYLEAVRAGKIKV